MTNTDVVSALRPEPAPLDPTWGEETLARILDSGGPRSAGHLSTLPTPIRRTPIRGTPSRRHVPGRPLVAAAAAAVVVAGIAVSTIGSPEDAAAADLMSLAASAASYDGPVLQPGTWLHEQSTSRQRDSATVDEGATIDIRRESWTSWDGRVYVEERRPLTGVESEVVDRSSRASYADPTPRFAASLPDTAEGLLDYLGPRVSGSTTHDEALFEALTGLATSHTLPPQTLAATFTALAAVDGVHTEDVDVDGRPAVEVRFDEESTHSSDELAVDRATGQVLTTHQTSRQADYVSTTHLSEVVTELPAAARDAFSHDTDS